MGCTYVMTPFLRPFVCSTGDVTVVLTVLLSPAFWPTLEMQARRGHDFRDIQEHLSRTRTAAALIDKAQLRKDGNVETPPQVPNRILLTFNLTTLPWKAARIAMFGGRRCVWMAGWHMLALCHSQVPAGASSRAERPGVYLAISRSALAATGP